MQYLSVFVFLKQENNRNHLLSAHSAIGALCTLSNLIPTNLVVIILILIVWMGKWNVRDFKNVSRSVGLYVAELGIVSPSTSPHGTWECLMDFIISRLCHLHFRES